MNDPRRRFLRFNINFIIYSNDIKGEGLNISKKGLGVLTDEEIIPAEEIPFEISLEKSSIIKKNYKIKGMARLLFSIPSKTFKNKYYNGFEFIELSDDNKNKLFDLLKELLLK
jgi:hypothetical protein